MAGPQGESLARAYDLLMFDLDGVVYVDGHAVEHAAESIADARQGGAHIAFITNNASRPPEQVASHLRELGVEASPGDVVTSSQAAARVLVETYGPGARIAVLGADGLVAALREADLEPVAVGDQAAVAIVSGYAPDLSWGVIMRGATLIRNGLPWVATNTDLTLKTGEGLAPGHGLLVRLISEFAGVTPRVAGKPLRPLLDETRRRVEGERPLMVGDRLDTDIAGAHQAQTDSLLVMTGVSSLSDLLAADDGERPTWIGQDLTALLRPGCRPQQARDGWRAGPWTARVEDGRMTVARDSQPGTQPGSGAGSGAGEADAWWTAVAAAGWDHLDRTGTAADPDGLTGPDRAASPG